MLIFLSFEIHVCINEFKDIDQVFHSFEIHVCTNEQTQECDEEYSINDKSWILVPSQLEEGLHTLIENVIEINISNDPQNPKIIQLGENLKKDE